MIQRLQVLHYRALKYIDIKFSRFNILIGPNASGKSTILDVINLIKDILDESPRVAVERRVSCFDELLWKRQGDKFEIAIEIVIPNGIKERLKDKEFSLVRYEICLHLDDKKGVIISGENLWLIKKSDYLPPQSKKGQMDIFPKEPEEPPYVVYPHKRIPSGWRKVISKSGQGNDYFKSETTDWNITYRFGPSKASLARLPEDEERFPISLWTKDFLIEGIQFLQFNSNLMRQSCRPDAPVNFQVDGSNLPKVVQYLKREKPDSFIRWIEHIKTALPEIEEIEVKEKIEDRFLYLNIRHKSGIEIPSWVISDGTVRLLAQTIIAYLPEKDRSYMIEEPENGLHPLAIETVFQSLSSLYENQILLASHSPVILRLTEPKDILCFSKTESGAVDIVSGEHHPNLQNWRKDIDLATLHAAGVLQ